MKKKTPGSSFVGAEKLMDQYIGHQLLKRREKLGMTLQQVFEGLNIPIEQLERYEQGLDSIPASVLGEIAVLYEVSLEYFFETVPS